VGSTTVAPIAQALERHLEAKHPGLDVVVESSGSGAGAKALAARSCHIAMLSRALKQKEVTACNANQVVPQQHVVGLDGIAIAVRPDSSVTGLSRAQLRQIYAGTITDWRDVGGRPGPILAFTRDTSSGTYGAFCDLVLDGGKPFAGAFEVGSNDELAQAIADNPGAIGYISLGHVSDRVKPLRIDGVAPSRQTVLDGSYPVLRSLFMYTDGDPTGRVAELIDLTSSPAGVRMIEEIGFVAVPR
jgi:phosphate transport system substrate-binding protein